MPCLIVTRRSMHLLKTFFVLLRKRLYFRPGLHLLFGQGLVFGTTYG
uniref:SH-1 n=1 Tax=Arundo donax TaxID=35708 RepID=A0A0A9EAZ3_ARUDO